MNLASSGLLVVFTGSELFSNKSMRFADQKLKELATGITPKNENLLAGIYFPV
jgi:signal transduction histidine kinase